MSLLFRNHLGKDLPAVYVIGDLADTAKFLYGSCAFRRVHALLCCFSEEQRSLREMRGLANTSACLQMNVARPAISVHFAIKIVAKSVKDLWWKG